MNSSQQQQQQPPLNAAEAGKPEPATAHAEGSTRCDGCKSCGAILELDGCGHRFHPRCVFTWPLKQCELCASDVQVVRVFREYSAATVTNSMVRKGKWSADEHKYANVMMKQFQLGALPLVDGLHLRDFIAHLLQCDPLRVTKKYAGQAIGKQNYCHRQRKSYSYSLHMKLQKRVSSLRNHYYWYIQHRCKMGFGTNIQQLKANETSYWIREFLKFADRIGQKIELTAPVTTIAAPVTVTNPIETEQTTELSKEDAVESPKIAPATPELEPKAEPSAEPKEEPSPSGSFSWKSAASFSLSTAVSDKANNSSAESIEKEIPAVEVADWASPKRECSLSPLSSEEWNDESLPSFSASLDDLVFADLSQTQLSVLLPPNTTVVSSPVKRKNGRGSLGEWLDEEEARWNESMTVPSWSFSMSDCA